ncbi:Transposon Ty3-G Gag-Pol polyprotein, partial [Trichinella nativa]
LMVLVNKKDGSSLFCVDYRELNEVTRKDAQLLPRIDATLDASAGAKWITTLDLASGY